MTETDKFVRAHWKVWTVIFIVGCALSAVWNFFAGNPVTLRSTARAGFDLVCVFWVLFLLDMFFQIYDKVVVQAEISEQTRRQVEKP
jgi:hypothetical protein